MIQFPQLEHGHTIQHFQTVLDALEKMEQLDINDLVLLNGNKYRGFFTKKQLISFDLQTILQTIEVDRANPCDEHSGFADLWLFYCENLTEQIPFMDQREEYLGVVQSTDLIEWYKKSMTIPKTGHILILGKKKTSSQKSELQSKIEILDISNVLKIASHIPDLEYLTFLVQEEFDFDQLMKFNTNEIQIIKTHTNSETEVIWNDKVDEFIHYLNV